MGYSIIHRSSFIIRHSSFIIHHSSSIIIHHWALIIVHSAGIICHSLFQKSMKNRWEIYQKSIKNGPKINAKATKIGLGPPWSRLGAVQASKTPLRVNSWILLSLSNEMAILAKNGDFVREWEQCQKWPRKVKIESIPKVRRVLARADGRAGSSGLQLGSQGGPKRIRKSRQKHPGALGKGFWKWTCAKVSFWRMSLAKWPLLALARDPRRAQKGPLGPSKPHSKEYRKAKKKKEKKSFAATPKKKKLGPWNRFRTLSLSRKPSSASCRGLTKGWRRFGATPL